MINTTSARLAITVATASGYRSPEWVMDFIQGSNKPDNIPAILHGLDAGRILAAVDTCTEPVRTWLLICYGCDGYTSNRQLHVATSHLYLEHARQRSIREMPAKIASVAGAVIADSISRYRNPSREPAIPSEFTHAAGLAPNQFSQIEPIIDSMRNTTETWDRHGLTTVAAALPRKLQNRVA